MVPSRDREAKVAFTGGWHQDRRDGCPGNYLFYIGTGHRKHHWYLICYDGWSAHHNIRRAEATRMASDRITRRGHPSHRGEAKEWGRKGNKSR